METGGTKNAGNGGYVMAIGAIGLALVAFLVCAGVIQAVGQPVVSEYWTVGSALGGGLLGLLGPAPNPKAVPPKDVARQAASAHTHAATAAAHAAAAHSAAAAVPTGGPPADADLDPAVADKHAEAARELAGVAEAEAAKSAVASPKAIVAAYVPAAALFLLFVTSTVVSLACNVKELQPFAAASGTALIGLFAESPTAK